MYNIFLSKCLFYVFHIVVKTVYIIITMNNLQTKFKNTALFLMFISLLLVSCINDKIEDENEKSPEIGTGVNLLIKVPRDNLSTYSIEPGTVDENHIDTIFINILEDGVLKDFKKIYGADINTVIGSKDSIINVSFDISNLTGGDVTAEVFANRMEITPITGEIPLPDKSNPQTTFMMSGSGALTLNGTSYSGTIHVVRNVAKLRVRISKHAACLPSDLIINYDEITVEVQQVADRTQLMVPPPVITPTGLAYINYTPRKGATLRPIIPFASFTGGQIDSLYLNENYLDDSAYTPTNKTQVKITLSTQEPGMHPKTAEYTYQLFTEGSYRLKRNHIYILDLKVVGQTLDPQITLDIQPWKNVDIDGDIHGSTLVLNKSTANLNSTNITDTIIYYTDNSSISLDWSKVKPEHNIDTSVKYIQGSNGYIEIFWNEKGAPDFYFVDTLYVRAGNIIKAVFIDYNSQEEDFGLPGSL